MKKIAITTGDPNSISPEIIIKALNKLDLPEKQVVIIGNTNVFEYYSNNYGLKLNKNYEIIEIPFEEVNIKPGKETKEAGDFAYQALVKACTLAKEGLVKAIVTAPISKHSINLAGHHFDGQTEILEKNLAHSAQKAEMLFISDKLWVMLLTRHVAIKNVPELITKDLIIEKTQRLNNSLKNNFNIKTPKLALCALNPHAGEDGLFGDEEKKEYLPAIKELKASGINVEGPFPADALFAHFEEKDFDCYIASYHDQGLIPVKLLGQSTSVNTTIGLDVIRTSPAHGTAFDIAGKIKADETSMISAIKIALKSL